MLHANEVHTKAVSETPNSKQASTMLLRSLLKPSTFKALKPRLHGSHRRKWKVPQRCSFGTAGGMLSRVVKESQSDPGKVIMNIGAIASLSGFMMSDIMHLRILSVVGSGCGITYNLTRKPPQINAVLWGLVFASVNIYQLYHRIWNAKRKFHTPMMR